MRFAADTNGRDLADDAVPGTKAQPAGAYPAKLRWELLTFAHVWIRFHPTGSRGPEGSDELDGHVLANGKGVLQG